jgi:hypothetical protein
MSDDNIELELRAEISGDKFEELLAILRKQAKLVSHTKRLSVMHFGKIGDYDFDIRVRITNGEAEVVIKRGGFHSDNRVEISQPINKDQFMGMVHMLSLFNFTTKVAERETYNFDLGDEIIYSLVKAGNIFYVEIEKISSKDSIEENRKKLLSIINKQQLKLINTEKSFSKLCDRLSKYCDWSFDNSEDHFKKLQELLDEKSLTL